MLIGTDHTVILLLKLDDPPILPHLTSHKTFKIQAGPRLDLIGPQGTRRFFGSPPPGPTRSYWFEPWRDTQGLRGFRARQGPQEAGFGLSEKNGRRNLRVLFLKPPRKAFRKNCLPNKMFPPKNQKLCSKQSIFFWCVSFMILRFHYDDYQRNKLSLLNLRPDITNKFDTLRIANPELPLTTNGLSQNCHNRCILPTESISFSRLLVSTSSPFS